MMTQKTIKLAFPSWEIVIASNGEEGLLAAEKQRFSLALIDYNMPGMNGLEMAEQLKIKHPEMLISLVTANIQEKMRHKAEASGVGFITKPISKEKLSDIFARFSR
ncbi:MAG: response regulator [Magnetococcales bacterium]|nr:response regulator [Magnetococcales bacterium]